MFSILEKEVSFNVYETLKGIDKDSVKATIKGCSFGLVYSGSYGVFYNIKGSWFFSENEKLFSK